MSRFGRLATIWFLLLVAGFAAVFVLGRPLSTEGESLAAALHPPTPVSQEAAERSAATIVRLQYGQLSGAHRSIERRTDFGIDHWVVTYTDQSSPSVSGVEISITVRSGVVEVAAFP
jgi:hypothetical protein